MGTFGFLPWQRILRDWKSYAEYPWWMLRGRPSPDNHYYKMRRIRRLSQWHQCRTLIETGTFYGQTVNYAQRYFRQVMSVELFQPLFDYNQRQFANNRRVHLFKGDSSQRLGEMIEQAHGPILYWLDGHYSGKGTGLGETTSPILGELELIRRFNRQGDCILIDDRRLFGPDDGYPTLEQTTAALRAIDENYQIYFDCDCIVAAPR